MTAKSVTVEQLATAMAVAGFAVPDREEQWTVPTEDARRIFAAIPDEPPDLIDAEWDTVLGGQPAHVTTTGLATLPEGVFEGDQQWMAAGRVVEAAVAWRETFSFEVPTGTSTHADLLRAVDAYRDATQGAGAQPGSSS